MYIILVYIKYFIPYFDRKELNDDISNNFILIIEFIYKIRLHLYFIYWNKQKKIVVSIKIVNTDLKLFL